MHIFISFLVGFFCLTLLGNQVEAAVLTDTGNRIWNMFPRFCMQAKDIQATFPLMAAGLCNTFIQNAGLREPITAGIQALIATSKV